MRNPLAAALLAGLALAAPAAAQEPAESVPTPASVGLDILVAQPVGEFDEAIGAGFGIGVHGFYRLDDRGVLSLRADLGFINYGNETKEVCFSTTVGCRVQLDLTTSNNIFMAGVGPQLMVPAGPLRPYLHGGVGFANFSTTSSVEGTDGDQEDFASTNNLNDTNFALTGGGGFFIPLRIGRSEIAIDLGARYHHNGEARYLREGDITDHPDGSITLDIQESEANFVTYYIGGSFRISRERE